MPRKPKKADKQHQQLFILGVSLQECKGVEEVAQAKKYTLNHKAYCTLQTPLKTTGHPDPAEQNLKALRAFALEKLTSGRFTHIAVNKGNKEVKDMAISLRMELKKKSIEIGILAL